MRNVRFPIIFLLIFLLSFALRMSLISKGPYNVDCLTLASEAERTLSSGQLGHMLGTGYPLTVITGALFIFIFNLFHIPDPVLAVNFMSVVASSLGVLAFYFLSRELFGRTAAFFSAVMLSACPIFLGISVYGKSQPLNLVLLISGIYFLFAYKREKFISSLILGGFFIGCTGANRLHELVLLFFPISYLLMWPARKTDAKALREEKLNWNAFFLFWSLVGVITALGHLPYFIQENSAAYFKQIADWFDAGFHGKFVFGYSPRIWIGAGYLVRSLTWAGIAVFLGGMFLIFKMNRRTFLFLFLWIIFPYVFYSNSSMSVTPRYFVIVLPPVLLAQGYMFSYLVNKHKALKFASAVLLLVIINVLWFRIYPMLVIRHENAYLPQYARWISRNTEAGARIISSDESSFIKRYGGRSPLARPLGARRISPGELDQFKREVDALLDDKVPVYIHSVSLYSYDPGRNFERFMMENYHLLWVGAALYEDWHRGEMASDIFPNHLYKVEKAQI